MVFLIWEAQNRKSEIKGGREVDHEWKGDQEGEEGKGMKNEIKTSYVLVPVPTGNINSYCQYVLKTNTQN